MRRTRERLAVGMVLAAAAALAAGGQEESPVAITGVVASGAGPEAGVWVIAETGDLPTGHHRHLCDHEHSFRAAARAAAGVRFIVGRRRGPHASSV